MKLLISAAFAAVMLAAPAIAAPISDVDHPDIPNCAIFPKGGVNPPNCETLSIMAVHGHNGQGEKSCWISNSDDTKHCVLSW